jgi:hypothetical protein
MKRRGLIQPLHHPGRMLSMKAELASPTLPSLNRLLPWLREVDALRLSVVPHVFEATRIALSDSNRARSRS